MLKNILVPLDGSEPSVRALALACDLAGKYGARIHLLNVVDNLDLSDELRHFAEAEHLTGSSEQLHQIVSDHILDHGRNFAIEHGCADPVTEVRQGPPGRRIVDYAATAGIDTIVMGSRGLSDLKGLLFGSVSHKVAERAPCTCITVR
jgi:nucleotide-binding universal stress UspA family protein